MQGYEFAEIAGEFQGFSARAIDNRPYVLHRPFLRNKNKHPDSGVLVQTVKKVISNVEVYQNALHQSLPCVRGGGKNPFDF